MFSGVLSQHKESRKQVLFRYPLFFGYQIQARLNAQPDEVPLGNSKPPTVVPLL